MDESLVLVATRDPALAADAARWVAAAGAQLVTAGDSASARRAWRAAAVVLVGGDLLASLAADQLPRRDQIVVVTSDGAEQWRDAVALGAAAVVDRADEAAVLAALTDALDGRAEACLITMVGACGGLGASTLAAATAVEATRRGARSLVLDADPLGGGIDLVLGCEHAAGMRWHDLSASHGHVAAAALTAALPEHHGTAVLSFGRGTDPAPDVTPFVRAAVRGYEVVVTDPSRTGLDTPGGLAHELASQAVLGVLLVRDDIRGLAAAGRVIDLLAEATANVALVLRPSPGGLGEREVERALGLPVLTRLRTDRSLPARLDHGHGPGRSRPLRRAAGALLDAVGVQ